MHSARPADRRRKSTRARSSCDKVSCLWPLSVDHHVVDTPSRGAALQVGEIPRKRGQFALLGSTGMEIRHDSPQASSYGSEPMPCRCSPNQSVTKRLMMFLRHDVIQILGGGASIYRSRQLRGSAGDALVMAARTFDCVGASTEGETAAKVQ